MRESVEMPMCLTNCCCRNISNSGQRISGLQAQHLLGPSTYWIRPPHHGWAICCGITNTEILQLLIISIQMQSINYIPNLFCDILFFLVSCGCSRNSRSVFGSQGRGKLMGDVCAASRGCMQSKQEPTSSPTWIDRTNARGSSGCKHQVCHIAEPGQCYYHMLQLAAGQCVQPIQALGGEFARGSCFFKWHMTVARRD